LKAGAIFLVIRVSSDPAEITSTSPPAVVEAVDVAAIAGGPPAASGMAIPAAPTSATANSRRARGPGVRAYVLDRCIGTIYPRKPPSAPFGPVWRRSLHDSSLT
jgi:hypothetical protein